MNPGVGDTPFCEAVPDAFHHGARAAGEEIEVIAREMLLEQVDCDETLMIESFVRYILGKGVAHADEDMKIRQFP